MQLKLMTGFTGEHGLCKILPLQQDILAGRRSKRKIRFSHGCDVDGRLSTHYDKSMNSYSEFMKEYSRLISKVQPKAPLAFIFLRIEGDGGISDWVNIVII